MISTRITKRFQHLSRRKKKAFIPYICAGDPDMEMTEQLVMGMERIGVDIIELGIPFSDSMADGPVILNSISRSLEAGTTLHSVLLMVQRVRKKTEIPIVFMVAYNLLYNYGLQRFTKMAAAVGVDGLIVPDLPVEESGELFTIIKNKLNLIYLVSPASSTDRIHLLRDRASGFIYFISLKGVTGIREDVDLSISKQIERVRRIVELPVALGFGISEPKHIGKVKSFVDGTVVGSAIVKKIEENIGSHDLVTRVLDFIKPMIHELKK